MARCPAHDDRTPSLHITITDDDAILWHCHAGCTGEEVREALRERGALPDQNGEQPPPRRRRKPKKPKRNPLPVDEPLPGAIWRAARAPGGTAGALYLASRTGPGAGGLHDIRWLPTRAAGRTECHPALPAGAAGAVVYRFRRLDETADDQAGACQIEAIDGRGRRLPFKTSAMRVSITGSKFDDSQRLFITRRPQKTGGIWICEGPMDAISLSYLVELELLDTGAAGLAGTAGVGRMRPESMTDLPRPVVLAPDNDAEGKAQIARFTAAAVSQPALEWRAELPPAEYHDWTDWVEKILETEGIERQAQRSRKRQGATR